MQFRMVLLIWEMQDCRFPLVLLTHPLLHCKNQTDHNSQPYQPNNQMKGFLVASQPVRVGSLTVAANPCPNGMLFKELEMEEAEEEERTVKAPPARVVTEEDMAHGGYIFIRRTWTNTELYRLTLTVQPGEGGINRKIEAITWEKRQGNLMSEEQAKIEVVLLCRSQLECDLAAAPVYDTLQFSDFQPIDADSTT